MVNGFLDVENRLDYLTANGDILPALKHLIPWEEFRSELEVIYDHERKSNAGRRPFDVVMMFKILIRFCLNLNMSFHILWQTLRCVNVGVVSQVFASGQAIREASLTRPYTAIPTWY